MHSYDDPYKILANNLVVLRPTSEIHRLLNDPTYLKAELLRETIAVDFRGLYLDCVMEDIICSGDRKEMYDKLREFGAYLYTKLDVSRLKREVRAYCERFNIEV